MKTPLLYDVDTYITSGHYDNYKENMFFVASKEADEKQFALKPMNCPGHMLLFGSALRSYRDLPLRYAESSTLHRDELAGTLHGLLRVRHVTQDDAHIFCTPEQIEGEIFGCLDFAHYLYDLFGLDARFELSTRPEKRTGTDEEWDFTEGALRAALDRRGIDYTVNEGDGAFYGPKIDLHMTDVLGARGRWARSSSTRSCRRRSASPTWAPTTASTRRMSSIVRSSARSSASSAF